MDGYFAIRRTKPALEAQFKHRENEVCRHVEWCQLTLSSHIALHVYVGITVWTKTERKRLNGMLQLSFINKVVFI